MADVLALDDELLESLADGAREAVEAAGEALAAAGEALVDTATSAGEALAAAGEALVDTATTRSGRKKFLGLVLLVLIGLAVWKVIEQRKDRDETG